MSIELHVFFIVYGVLSISHLLIQYVFAHLHATRHASTERDYRTSVVALVPVYNESPQRLRRCLRSLQQQTHRNMHMVVIDDGSKNKKDLEWIYQEFAIYDNVTIVQLAKNEGKREAQHQGFLRYPTADLYLTVDSDTIVDAEAVAVLAARFSNPRIGAVTGDVQADNWQTNWLTHLIHRRYWSAFHVERAAQSYFNAVTCCSGPLSMYRGGALQQVWERYITQKFLGRPCTFGDDRHLTNLILREKYQAVFEPQAHARTHVPEKLFWDYIKQQWRWSMSFYREMLWNVKFLSHQHPFMTYDLAMQAILPFMLLGCLFLSIMIALHGHAMVAVWYVATMFGMGLLRSVYGVWRTGEKGFLVFAVYGIIHVTLLVPLRVYALVTLFARRTSWGTR